MKKWIGEAIVKMHFNKIMQEEIANKMKVSRGYINKILNGNEQYTPKNAEERILSAIDEIISDRKEL